MKEVKGNIVDIVNKEIFPGKIEYNENGIFKISRINDSEYDNFILPGFIDSHIHIESTMMSPNEFARIAVKKGSVAVVADPHEIANVCGSEGVEYMYNNSKNVPFKFYYGVPSCVPATPFEKCGGLLSAVEIESLFKTGHYHFLGEFMNVPGVVNEDPVCIDKIKLAQKYKLPLDGHAPNISSEELDKYVEAGISTDHEFFTIEESIMKIQKGMMIQIREGSASRDFDNLFPLIDMYPDSVMFCTDDSHPEDLLNLGHIDKIVKRAISKGANIFNVLRAASYNAIKHYNLNVGLLQEGDPADFIVVDNLKDFNVIKNVINSESVVDNNTVNIPYKDIDLINNFNTRLITLDELLVPMQEGKRLRVIDVKDGSLVSDSLLIDPKVENNTVVSDIDKDILKIVLHNRYTDIPLQIAFIKGFGLKGGAFASSIGHDSHNILAIGTNDIDIKEAINSVVEAKGGMSVVNNSDRGLLELPIAGLMSNKDIYTIDKNYNQLLKKVEDLGCAIKSPFMTLAFMSLIVIPNLKLGADGLFDYSSFSFVDLFE